MTEVVDQGSAALMKGCHLLLVHAAMVPVVCLSTRSH